MEENRHGPERLGQITPKREKNRGKNNSSGVGVVLESLVEDAEGGLHFAPQNLLCSPGAHPILQRTWVAGTAVVGSSGHSRLCVPLDLGPFLCLPGCVWVANTSGKI